MFSDSSPPVTQTHIFKAQNWQDNWIETTRNLIQEFNHSYASLADNDNETNNNDNNDASKCSVDNVSLLGYVLICSDLFSSAVIIFQ